jgi:transposase
MEKEDARNQTLEQLHERRKQVVRLHIKGIKVMKIVTMTGLSYPTVRNTIDLFKDGGWKAIAPARRGRTVGQARLLRPEQEARIRRLIVDHRPNQLKLEFFLWSVKAVAQLVLQETGVELSERTTGKYLKRWGYTPQKPIKRAYERCPKAVQEWLDERYPDIEKRAKAEGAEIFWGDQTAIVNTDNRGRSFAPCGQTPVIDAYATRQKLSMMAAVSNQGRAHWMMIDEAFNADRLIEFMDALIKDSRGKVILILDNLRIHHSAPVKEWLKGREAEIEVHYLPSYSPDLNPEERLNADLKQRLRKSVQVRSKDRLRAAATKHMDEIVKSPSRIKSYFQDQAVKYAA